jgi:hypothetical protein
VFRRLYGWGFQPARYHLRGASTLRRPAQPCFAGSTAGDFNPLGLICGAPPRLGAPLNRVSPALRLGISTRSVSSVFFGNPIRVLRQPHPCTSANPSVFFGNPIRVLRQPHPCPSATPSVFVGNPIRVPQGHVHRLACTLGGAPSKNPSPLIGNMHFGSLATPRVTTPRKSPRFPPHFTWTHRFQASRSTVSGPFCPDSTNA